MSRTRHEPSAARAALLLMLAVAPSGCAVDEITIRVCGNVVVPTDVDALRLELLDEDLVRIRDGVLALVPEDGGPVRTLPVTPRLDAAEGRGWVRVVGLKEQVAVVQFDRQVVDLGDVEEVDAVLSGSCLRASCPAGQTCIAGSCVPAPLQGEAPDCGGR